MNTVYYTTSNYIRHNGNVVDLTEYRRRLERVEGASETAAPTAEPPAAPAPRSRRPTALWGDWCATGAILAMTVVVVCKFCML